MIPRRLIQPHVSSEVVDPDDRQRDSMDSSATESAETQWKLERQLQQSSANSPRINTCAKASSHPMQIETGESVATLKRNAPNWILHRAHYYGTGY